MKNKRVKKMSNTRKKTYYAAKREQNLGTKYVK